MTGLFARSTPRVLLTAVAYGIPAWALFTYIERTMAVTITRLLVTVALAFGFPLVLTLAWILSGANVRRRATRVAVGGLMVGGLLWLANTSSFRGSPQGPFLIAHRGVHQRMHAEHDDPFACVSRIHPPTHAFIENTVASMQAAFDHGARFVEIDIRETADGDFAVFHDDRLDCKTETRGPVAARPMDELRTLDVGYGYVTAAGDYPVRGRGVGMMRSLDEVLNTFPGKGFIIDVKFGNDSALWQRLIAYLSRRERADLRRLAVYGAPRGVETLRHELPDVVTGSRELALVCARDYLVLGWSGYMPARCRRAMTGTYVDTGWMFWGWPTRFVERMERAGSIVVMQRREQSEQEFAASIPVGYEGGVQTDRVESFRQWMAVTAP